MQQKGVASRQICIFGGKDQEILAADVDAIRSTLAKQPNQRYDVLVYPEADYGFFCDERPSYHAESAQDAWKKTLTWLGNTMRQYDQMKN